MSYEGAAASLVKFQEYAMTDILAEFGAEVVLTKGGEAGNVTFAITGGFFGESEAALNKTFAPFLAVMPPPTNIRYTGNGTWISALEDLGGGVLDTHTAGPDGTNTFYAKSLMTPQDDLMTYKASEAFMKYLAYEGYASDTVRFTPVVLYRLIYVIRAGSCKPSYMGAETQPSMRSPSTQRHLRQEVHCLRYSFMQPPSTIRRLILMMASLSWIVSLS